MCAPSTHMCQIRLHLAAPFIHLRRTALFITMKSNVFFFFKLLLLSFCTNNQKNKFDSLFCCCRCCCHTEREYELFIRHAYCIVAAAATAVVARVWNHWICLRRVCKKKEKHYWNLFDFIFYMLKRRKNIYSFFSVFCIYIYQI